MTEVQTVFDELLSRADTQMVKQLPLSIVIDVSKVPKLGLTWCGAHEPGGAPLQDVKSGSAVVCTEPSCCMFIPLKR
jgi:hypothetical protein